MDDKEAEDECEEKKDEIEVDLKQTALDLTKLRAEALDRASDDSCVRNIEMTRTVEEVQLARQREEASPRLDHAVTILRDTLPLLELLKEDAKKMEHRITVILTPECAENKEV